MSQLRGFTLIEVMVALSIFGLAALAALQSASGHLTGLSALQNKTFAQYVASNRLAEISLAEQWPVEDKRKGQQKQAGVTWYWQQSVTETVTPDVVAITVKVMREEGGREHFRLTRYLRKPDAAGESSNGR
ncbi:type II secretion system minor pseudopilin GspI [Idiomarina sp. HP20-50]|uniref:type II secretion system minor pseudopilin GspI n=1 Tax=Idiomarina sp. HP20-50 TaxID=3070813 RepID=UPI00294AE640|nr:type II secretion system minor pseudopilin GspI [Idiomarina sp. HP20-50]MDV6315772.1 type II secretion system minor pseudopilin GspI [Idiomarina sp. HP20-50]